MPIPPTATGSLAERERQDGRYLSQVAGYYRRLAAEAPARAGRQVRVISSVYRGLAGSIASGAISSLGQVQQQITSLTSSGAAATAFKKLILYVTTKCA